MVDATAKSFSGTAARLLLNGKVIGWATDVSVQEAHNNFLVEVLGLYDAVEVVPTGRRIAAAASIVRIMQDSLVGQRIWPGGTNKQMIVFPHGSLEVYNCITQTVLYRIVGLRAEALRWQVGKHTLSAHHVTFVGTSLYDEMYSSIAGLEEA